MTITPKPNFVSVLIASAIGTIVFLSIAPTQTLAKSRRPISDIEIREKKNQCYADIESGLWGWQCKASMIAKENCALRCLSPACYDLVYEGDPLEEGEKDIFRSQEYKYCMHKYLSFIRKCPEHRSGDVRVTDMAEVRIEFVRDIFDHFERYQWVRAWKVLRVPSANGVRPDSVFRVQFSIQKR